MHFLVLEHHSIREFVKFHVYYDLPQLFNVPYSGQILFSNSHGYQY